MSFLDEFSQWNKSCSINQRSNTNEMKFPRLTTNKQEKNYLDIHLFYQ